MKLMDISQRCTKLKCLKANSMENDLDHENEKLNVYVESETNIWERRGGVGEIRMNKNEWIVLFKNICYIDIQNHNQLMKVNIAADAASHTFGLWTRSPTRKLESSISNIISTFVHTTYNIRYEPRHFTFW